MKVAKVLYFKMMRKTYFIKNLIKLNKIYNLLFKNRTRKRQNTSFIDK